MEEQAHPIPKAAHIYTASKSYSKVQKVQELL